MPTKAEFGTLLNNFGGTSDNNANYIELIQNGNSGFCALFSVYRGITDKLAIYCSISLVVRYQRSAKLFWSLEIANCPNRAEMLVLLQF